MYDNARRICRGIQSFPASLIAMSLVDMTSDEGRDLEGVERVMRSDTGEKTEEIM